jgi:hypothetical protein
MKPSPYSCYNQLAEPANAIELPVNLNPLLLSQLFWKQSQLWETVAIEHIEKVAELCKDFV